MFIDIEHPVMAIGIDKTFVRVCEPGTLRIRSVTSEDIGLGHSKCELVMNNQMASIMFEADEVVTHAIRNKGKIRLAVTITGIRRGHTARFPIYSEQQAKRNIAFWSQAINA